MKKFKKKKFKYDINNYNVLLTESQKVTSYRAISGARDKENVGEKLENWCVAADGTD